MRKKGTHPKEVPWENEGEDFEDLSRLAVASEILSCPHSSQLGPQGFRGEELLSPGRTAVKPELSS